MSLVWCLEDAKCVLLALLGSPGGALTPLLPGGTPQVRTSQSVNSKESCRFQTLAS